MKPSPRPPRAPSTLSDSVHNQLDLYTLAATAAGIGLLALAQPAQAKVVYTSTHQWIPLNQRYLLDLNNDGVTDFNLLLHSSLWSTGTVRSLNAYRAAQSQTRNRIYSGGCNDWVCAPALVKGAKIGRNNPFKADSAWLFFQSAKSQSGVPHLRRRKYGKSFGPWLYQPMPAYLGLQFSVSGKIHYGWARIKIRWVGPNAVGGPKALLTGYAYETIPNKPIVAGKTKGAEVVTVQPGSTPVTLGKLALGRK